MKKRKRRRWDVEDTVYFWLGVIMLVYLFVTVWLIVGMAL